MRVYKFTKPCKVLKFPRWSKTRARSSGCLTVKTFLKAFTLAANTITEVLFTVPTDAANWICENTAAAGSYLAIGALAGADYQTTTTDAWITGNYLTTADATNWLATANELPVE